LGQAWGLLAAVEAPEEQEVLVVPDLQAAGGVGTQCHHLVRLDELGSCGLAEIAEQMMCVAVYLSLLQTLEEWQWMRLPSLKRLFAPDLKQQLWFVHVEQH
jgi:hypothetical protein